MYNICIPLSDPINVKYRLICLLHSHFNRTPIPNLKQSCPFLFFLFLNILSSLSDSHAHLSRCLHHSSITHPNLVSLWASNEFLLHLWAFVSLSAENASLHH